MYPSLVLYIEREVLPRYERFDAAHREDHAQMVIKQSLGIARHYPVIQEMVYAIAAFHDLGLEVDRKTHHLESGRIVRETERLKEWFSPEDTYSGRYPFTHSGDIRSLGRRFDGAKLILFS